MNLKMHCHKIAKHYESKLGIVVTKPIFQIWSFITFMWLVHVIYLWETKLLRVISTIKLEEAVQEKNSKRKKKELSLTGRSHFVISITHLNGFNIFLFKKIFRLVFVEIRSKQSYVVNPESAFKNGRTALFLKISNLRNLIYRINPAVFACYLADLRWFSLIYVNLVI